MKRIFRSLVEEIADNLAPQMDQGDKPESDLLLDLLFTELSEEVTKRLAAIDVSRNPTSQEKTTAQNPLVPRPKEPLMSIDKDQDEEVEGDSSYPNLKYARPKYKDVDSVLKYIERDDDRTGLKLVIMNFND